MVGLAALDATLHIYFIDALIRRGKGDGDNFDPARIGLGEIGSNSN
jgi:hypothetical protein